MSLRNLPEVLCHYIFLPELCSLLAFAAEVGSWRPHLFSWLSQGLIADLISALNLPILMDSMKLHLHYPLTWTITCSVLCNSFALYCNHLFEDPLVLNMATFHVYHSGFLVPSRNESQGKFEILA